MPPLGIGLQPETRSLRAPQIKDAANKNNVTGAKLLAKQLVRLRAQQTKLQTAIASLRGVSTSVVVSKAAQRPSLH